MSIWEKRKEILEGIKNNIFKTEAVEAIAAERNKICESNVCGQHDTKGTECLVPGTAPCCGACGCSLKLKTRSLSSSCPKDLWKAVLTDEEELDLDSLRDNI